MGVVVAVAVRQDAVVAVVQIAAEAAVPLRQVQVERSAVLVWVSVVVVAEVAAADDTSGFLVLHGSELIIFHRFHH